MAVTLTSQRYGRVLRKPESFIIHKTHVLSERAWARVTLGITHCITVELNDTSHYLFLKFMKSKGIHDLACMPNPGISLKGKFYTLNRQSDWYENRSVVHWAIHVCDINLITEFEIYNKLVNA